MLTAQVEPLGAVADDLFPLVQLEWEECGHHRDQPEAALVIDRGRYAAMDSLGLVVVVTLRDGPKLVGYLTTLVSPALHFSKCLTAYHDLFFVLPAYRGRLGSLRLLRTTKAELQRRGVHRWFMGSTTQADASRLYAALGFAPAETFYSLWLGSSPRP